MIKLRAIQTVNTANGECKSTGKVVYLIYLDQYQQLHGDVVLNSSELSSTNPTNWKVSYANTVAERDTWMQIALVLKDKNLNGEG